MGLLRVMVGAMLGFFVAGGTALGQPQRIGDWTLDLSDSYGEAFTVNDSGSRFGFLCSRESCSFYLDFGLSCRRDSRVVMLVNAEAGATYVVSRCVGVRAGSDVRFIHAIQDRDLLEAVSSGEAVGFAVPMEGGQFRVIRFRLHGAVTAIGRAAGFASRSRSGTGDPRYRDRSM